MLRRSNAGPARCGKRGRLEAAPFSAPDVNELRSQWLEETQRAALRQEGQLDFAVSLTANQRLRASAFRQLQGMSLALRLLPNQCPTLDALDVPAALPELLTCENGLLLVSGATGSGKSTTLAAMVEWLNRHRDGHILTLEDPIEYRYASQRCLIQQREVGVHCSSFVAGLRAGPRGEQGVVPLGGWPFFPYPPPPERT